MNSDVYVNYSILVEFTVFQNASCIHRQSFYDTCYQVAKVTFFMAQKRKLDAKCSDMK